MKSGGLVPDDLILRLIRNELNQRGWIFSTHPASDVITLTSSAVDLSTGTGSTAADVEAFISSPSHVRGYPPARASDDPSASFLLDGFPRTVPQASALDKLLADLGIALDLVMELVVDDDEVIRRLSGRRTCRGCGKIWHVEFDPTSKENICDRCGSELFQRDDDKADTIANRLVEYTDKTAPLVDFYGAQGKLVGIDATGPVEDVTVRAIDALRSYGG